MRAKLKFAFVFALLVGSTSFAQILSATLDVLDGSDPGAPTPPGIIVLDGFVDVASVTSWTAAGIICETSNGARLRYHDGDANTPGVQPQMANPGADNDRFVSMISRPRHRNSLARFNNGAAAIAGGYTGGPAPGSQFPTYLNIAWFASPPMGPGDPSTDGYVIRLAFSVPGQTADTVRLTNTNIAPDAVHTVLLASVARPPSTMIGWVNATFNSPNPVGTDWFLWGIPEPHTAITIGLALTALIRRRRA